VCAAATEDSVADSEKGVQRNTTAEQLMAAAHSLQPTATHRNTPQHTATHRNTLHQIIPEKA